MQFLENPTLFLHLRLGHPSSLFSSSLPTKIMQTPLPFPMRATCLAHLILLYLNHLNNIR